MRYNNSFLGILWVLIKPYLTFVVLFVIWSRLSGGGVEFFRQYLLLGIIFYTYIQELVIFGQMSLLDKANIILKVDFPRQLAVLSSLVAAVINLMINLVLAFIIIYAAGITPSFAGLAYFVALVVTTFFMALGLSFFTSIFTIRFRDLKNIFELGFFLLFWTSPILYVPSNEDIGDGLASIIISYNPIGTLLNQVRASLNIYSDIELQFLLTYVLISLVLFITGWFFFNRQVKKVAEFF
jgi:ABC-2 type transport system permease protein